MPASQRPFWKRKRWIAAAVLWLVVAYPVSMGPLVYADVMGLVPEEASLFYAAYIPVFWIAELTGCEAGLQAYVDWWEALAVNS
jgi:hypothetical protein